jgi:hypothetical protein
LQADSDGSRGEQPPRWFGARLKTRGYREIDLIRASSEFMKTGWLSLDSPNPLSVETYSDLILKRTVNHAFVDAISSFSKRGWET